MILCGRQNLREGSSLSPATVGGLLTSSNFAQGATGLSTGDQLNLARQECGLRFGGTFDAYEVSIFPGFGERGVVGNLLSDEGRLLAEFEGRLTAAGAAGTYRDPVGGRGEWAVER